MWSSGRLTDLGADELLLLLAARSSTGTLSVQHEDVLAIRFRNGEILGADALKESLTHGLGRILVAAGHLDRDQIAALESAELEGSVIDHLLATELVPPETLAGCVRQHTYLLLLRLLGWQSGDYRFYEGEVAVSLEVRPLSVEEVLVRASEEDPRLLGTTIASLGGEILRPLLGRRAFRVLNWHQDRDDAVTPDDLWLTPFEDTLLRSLDGLTPASGFKDILGVDEFKLRHAFHRLRSAGLVESVGRPAAAPPGIAGPPSSTAPSSAAGNVDLGSAPAAADAWPARSAPRPEIAARPARWSESGGQLGDLSRLFSLILAGGLAAVVLALVLAGSGPSRLLLPFPWQEGRRVALETLRLTALHGDLIAKLKTYHILFGAFPLDLRPLVDSGLLRNGALEDERGREVAFEALDEGFVLSAEEMEDAPAGPRSRFGVAGDFLLDPDFAAVDGQPGGTAVQVLD